MIIEQILIGILGLLFTILGAWHLFKTDDAIRRNLDQHEKWYESTKRIPILRIFSAYDYWSAIHFEGKWFTKLWGIFAMGLGILFIFLFIISFIA